MADGDRASVVVANPDADVCEVLARVVEAAGHTAVRVTDPAGVTTAVLGSQADAVVLDAGAANLDALKDLRSPASGANASVRVIVVGSGPASARLAWQEGADAVLSRPFAATEVGQSLAASLGRDDSARAAERRSQVAALQA